MSERVQEIEQCLRELREGNRDALQRMMPLIYEDLRRLARVVQPQDAHSLNPTALVHEAYGRLVKAGAKEYADRSHFMSVAAAAMRNLLKDHAREQRAQKRGGSAQAVTLKTGDALDLGSDLDVVTLDELLDRFADSYPRHAKVVELRFLAGLSVEETADVLEVSARTVKTDWQMARAWLSRELRRIEEN